MRVRWSDLLRAGCAGAAIVWACAAGAAGEGGGGRNVPIGVNLEDLNDWSRLSPFVDWMKTSRAWGLPDKPWVHEVPTDALGWPTQDAGVVVRVLDPDPGDSRSRRIAAGTYRLSFRGRATVQPVSSSGVAVRGMKYDAASNRSTAEVLIGTLATQLMLSFVKTSGGVRDVQLVPAAAPAGETWSGEFRTAIGPFGTLRLMDFLRTNGNPVRRWSERTTPAAASQAGEKGGAWEYAVQLANDTGKDIWINVPALADDEYVRSLAALLQKSLAPDRVVYVEYSNELWNFIFPQATQNMEAAVAEAVAGDTTLTRGKRCTPQQFKASTAECNPYWAGYFRVGKRTVRIAQIFSEVFGPGALNSRVRVVYATQFADPAIAEQVLKNIATYRGKPSAFLHAVAAAPYFALDEKLARSPRLDAESIHAALQRSLDSQILPFLAPGVGQGGAFARGPYRGEDGRNPTLKALADHYGLKSFAYEGGPDLGQAEASLPAKFAATADPRMGAKMEQLLDRWYGCGNGLFVLFNLSSGWGQHGYWGLTNDGRDLDTPKYRAVSAVARRAAAEACR